MPVLIALISAFTGGFVYWLVRLDGLDVIAAMFSASARERRARHNLDSQARAAARSVNEPRDAALALMVRIGSVDGALLPAAESVVEEAARDIFAYGSAMTEHRAYAEYVARNTPNFSMLFRETSPVLNKLTSSERLQLVGLLEDVAKAAGGITVARQEMIDEVRAKLLPPPRRSV